MMITYLGKNTEEGSHYLVQGIFLTQELNLGLLHCRHILYHLSHLGRPINLQIKNKINKFQIKEYDFMIKVKRKWRRKTEF